MCITCYKEAGSPKIINGKVIIVAKAIQLVYESPYGGAGGHGHIVFDDNNLEDDNILYCYRLPFSKVKYEYYPRLTYERVKFALSRMLSLSLPERWTALALAHEWITDPRM